MLHESNLDFSLNHVAFFAYIFDIIYAIIVLAVVVHVRDNVPNFIKSCINYLIYIYNDYFFMVYRLFRKYINVSLDISGFLDTFFSGIVY